MQENIIIVITDPVTVKDVVYVNEIKLDAGIYSFVSTSDLDKAQRFGAEVDVVVDLLSKVARIDAPREIVRRFIPVKMLTYPDRVHRTFKDFLMATVEVALHGIVEQRNMPSYEHERKLKNDIEILQGRFGDRIIAEVKHHGGHNYSIHVNGYHEQPSIRIDVVNNIPLFT